MLMQICQQWLMDILSQKNSLCVSLLLFLFLFGEGATCDLKDV